MRTETMSESEKPFKPLPMDDGVVVKLPTGTDIVTVGNRVFRASGSPLYHSTKELEDKIAKPIYDNSSRELFKQGVKVEILEPGKKWVTGNLRLRLVFEFIPDEPENSKPPGESVSPLDDIRRMNL